MTPPPPGAACARSCTILDLGCSVLGSTLPLIGTKSIPFCRVSESAMRALWPRVVRISGRKCDSCQFTKLRKLDSEKKLLQRSSKERRRVTDTVSAHTPTQTQGASNPSTSTAATWSKAHHSCVVYWHVPSIACWGAVTLRLNVFCGVRRISIYMASVSGFGSQCASRD